MSLPQSIQKQLCCLAESVEDLQSQLNEVNSGVVTVESESLGTQRYLWRTGADYVSGVAVLPNPDFQCISRELPAGRFRNVRLHTTSTGAFAIVLVRANGDGTMTILDSKAVTTSGTGVITLSAGKELPNWILDGTMQIGIQLGTGGIPGLRYAGSGGGGAVGFVGTASGTFNVVSEPGLELYYTVDVDVEEERRGGFLVERTEFGCLPTGWVNGSTPFTFDPVSGAAVSAATGIANGLRSGTSISLDQQELIWEFGTAAGTIAAFYTSPTEGALNGSMVRVDLVAGQLQNYGLYTGANTPVLINSVPLSIPSGVKHRLIWRQSGRTYTVSVVSMDGTVAATLTRTAYPLGYTVYPSNFANDQGAMQGRAGAAAIAGQLGLYLFERRAICVEHPDLLIIGDSITEGFGVNDSQKWPQLVADAIGSGRVVISGAGGATTTSAMGRFSRLIQSLRPRAVLIYLGTNPDGSFSDNIMAMSLSARQMGARVYVATPAAGDAPATNTAIVNALPAWVTKIKFDVALTTGGAGTPVISALFAGTDAGGNTANDGVHPVASGHRVMKDRVVQDAPELFSNRPS